MFCGYTDRNMTKRANYAFVVKEYDENSPPWIMLEPRGGNLPILEKGFIGLDLRPGTSLEAAQEIAKFLNEKIQCVAHTDMSKF